MNDESERRPCRAALTEAITTEDPGQSSGSSTPRVPDLDIRTGGPPTLAKIIDLKDVWNQFPADVLGGVSRRLSLIARRYQDAHQPERSKP